MVFWTAFGLHYALFKFPWPIVATIEQQLVAPIKHLKSLKT